MSYTNRVSIITNEGKQAIVKQNSGIEMSAFGVLLYKDKNGYIKNLFKSEKLETVTLESVFSKLDLFGTDVDYVQKVVIIEEETDKETKDVKEVEKIILNEKNNGPSITKDNYNDHYITVNNTSANKNIKFEISLNSNTLKIDNFEKVAEFDGFLTFMKPYKDANTNAELLEDTYNVNNDCLLMISYFSDNKIAILPSKDTKDILKINVNETIYLDDDFEVATNAALDLNLHVVDDGQLNASKTIVLGTTDNLLVSTQADTLLDDEFSAPARLCVMNSETEKTPQIMFGYTDYTEYKPKDTHVSFKYDSNGFNVSSNGSTNFSVLCNNNTLNKIDKVFNTLSNYNSLSSCETINLINSNSNFITSINNNLFVGADGNSISSSNKDIFLEINNSNIYNNSANIFLDCNSVGSSGTFDSIVINSNSCSINNFSDSVIIGNVTANNDKKDSIISIGKNKIPYNVTSNAIYIGNITAKAASGKINIGFGDTYFSVGESNKTIFKVASGNKYVTYDKTYGFFNGSDIHYDDIIAYFGYAKNFNILKKTITDYEDTVEKISLSNSDNINIIIEENTNDNNLTKLIKFSNKNFKFTKNCFINVFNNSNKKFDLVYDQSKITTTIKNTINIKAGQSIQFIYLVEDNFIGFSIINNPVEDK